jgi:adenylate kinase
MKNIFIIGPQGSGKGTQAEMIVQEYGLTHIETGSMIRRRAELHDRKSELIDHLANKKGVLLPDGIVLGMIEDELAEKKNDKGYLFDGFPRTTKQYEAFKDVMKEKGYSCDAVLYLSVDDEEAIHRLTARRLCRICRRGYSLLSEPTRTTCQCGGLLAIRADDEAPTIARRLSFYHMMTEPILELMRKDGILFEINGQQDAKKIFEDIKHVLKEHVYGV